MNVEIKHLWLEALRSGKYEQCGGMLHRRDNGFCCLGVLCDLHAQSYPNMGWQENVANPHKRKYLGEDSVLPDAVVEWAGLDDGDPGNAGGGRGETLSGMNDRGDSFDMIADVIDQHF